MLAILKAYIDIALLRRGPDSLPYSKPLLALTVFALAALQLLDLAHPKLTLVMVAVAWCAEVIVAFAILWLLLSAVRKRERFVQTMTATFGAGLVISIAQVAVLALAGSDKLFANPQQFSVHEAAIAVLQLWFFAVWARILRSALEITVLQSIAIVVLTVLLQVTTVLLFVPAPAPVGVA